MRNLKMIFMIFAGLFFISSLALTGVTFGQEKDNPRQEIGVKGFLDEDGDGFNDLLPDRDGDGVPDAIDPDTKVNQPDTLMGRRNSDGKVDSTEYGRHMHGDDSTHYGMPKFHDPYQHMGPDFPGMPGMGEMPGEPGQYGPGDSTNHDGMHHHGGMDGDGGHDGWPPPPPPDSGGMGGHMMRPGAGAEENTRNSAAEGMSAPEQKNREPVGSDRHEGK